MQRTYKRTAIVTTSFLLSLSSINTFAASSQLFFDNVSGLGNNYSGEAAIADDASTLYFNPAGISRLPNKQLVAGNIEGRFNGKFIGSDDLNIPPLSIAQTGTAKGRATYAPFPFIYYTQPVNHQFSWGVGLLTPYGIGISVPQTSVMRYSGTSISMYVLDVTPGFSYQINEQLSAGLGFDAERFSIKASAMFPSFTGGQDAKITDTAQGWGYGWHGGLLYQLTKKTRIGLAYHSQVVFHARGQSEYVVTPGAGVGYEIIANNFKYNTVLPPTTTLSAYHDLNDTIALMGTIDYTQWSFLTRQLSINIAVPNQFGAPSKVSGKQLQYYQNTWRFALGSNYKLNDKWMLRLGLAVETDPTNDNYREVTDPGTAATSVAVGAHYQYIKTLGFDAGYIHYFIHNSSIHTVNGYNTENGTDSREQDAAGIQLTWDIV